ncbi:hypothetical protein M422DRAFT_263903 [Sphaerobolus stellatus SS14]|uniref:Unplaced genomic scaffold SPHSTscaffold_129, whole genome shotgun sequence n=1 Tax=Sphaerobolus stellatus (strain SS14) TaxID=990650 RepID=A0A0C9UXS1_SPHS4|nr:hypothetical protein M422DRAFT_263903 [Sphaerobolus stellatus SS14]
MHPLPWQLLCDRPQLLSFFRSVKLISSLYGDSRLPYYFLPTNISALPMMSRKNIIVVQFPPSTNEELATCIRFALSAVRHMPKILTLKLLNTWINSQSFVDILHMVSTSATNLLHLELHRQYSRSAPFDLDDVPVSPLTCVQKQRRNVLIAIHSSPAANSITFDL